MHVFYDNALVLQRGGSPDCLIRPISESKWPKAITDLIEREYSDNRERHCSIRAIVTIARSTKLVCVHNSINNKYDIKMFEAKYVFVLHDINDSVGDCCAAL